MNSHLSGCLKPLIVPYLKGICNPSLTQIVRRTARFGNPRPDGRARTHPPHPDPRQQPPSQTQRLCG
ncbi:hypothetical protein N657DRAFT_640706 [Parathielavia appendiculata]|uniref:Uncharacterized protein n=1 Tax=Parathielavia appendiculata TaxID=2587402 RepID=A0AAN6U885_9PEZI|nr:hypothetical protein N657DRAFT_640706 [Parathielavia appendiculata]